MDDTTFYVIVVLAILGAIGLQLKKAAKSVAENEHVRTLAKKAAENPEVKGAVLRLLARLFK